MKSLSSLGEFSYSQGYRGLTDSLEVIPNDIYGAFILLINKIKELIGFNHFSTDPEVIIPKIREFVDKKFISGQENSFLKFKLVELLEEFSLYCNDKQKEQIDPIIQFLITENTSIIPPRSKKFKKTYSKWANLSEKILKQRSDNLKLSDRKITQKRTTRDFLIKCLSQINS